MILTGLKIKEERRKNKIYIEPFKESQINPNSYDFRLGNTLKVYKNHIINPRIKQEVEEFTIPEEGFRIDSNRIYLGYTFETMGSEFYVPIIRAKSSIARMGIFIHVTADLIDIGSINQWTLQLHAVQPVIIFAGMLIGQVTFWKTKGKITLYHGKYQGSKGAIETQIYNDFV